VARLTLDGIPEAALARRWGVPQCALFQSLPSTLDAVHERAAQGAPGGTVVIAEEQTAGRGRDGRTWRSPAGGVWLAMLVRTRAPVVGALSLRVGLVLADVVDDMLDAPRAQLKWPNDVLLESRKLAGTLCESRWQGDTPQWLALGIGVNVANAIPAELAGRAIALAEVLPAVRRIDLLDRLVPALLPLTTHHAPLTDSECSAFAQRDWLRGRLIRAPLVGRAAGVRPDGALFVDTDAGPGVVREGHVELS
jgi:BirA family biotin operon repressor/biotin-[acetyl-CoA-carboxylase] ligase